MRAAFFDMDGTVLDSMQVWRTCNLIYLDRHGIEVSDDLRQRVISASSGMHLFDLIREETGHDVNVAEYRAIQTERVKEAYARGIPAKPGAREYLEHLHSRGVMTVLTTATPAAMANLALSRSGLMREFDAIYCCDIIGESKRRPAYFHAVCSLAGIPEDKCMLFEDADYALEGGREAGLLGAVAVTDDTNLLVRDRLSELSDIMVDSFAELMPPGPSPAS